MRDRREKELESRRQKDVENGAMEYGETAASREQARRNNHGEPRSEKSARDYHHMTCTIDIECADCGAELNGEMAWMSTGDCYCEECGEKHGLE